MRWVYWALLGVSAALIVALAASALASLAGPLGTGYGGMSYLASRSLIAWSAAQLASCPSRGIVVAYPTMAPTAKELRAVLRALSAGDEVLIAGSGPATNALLRGLGVNITVLNYTIVDLVDNAGSPLEPLANYSGGPLALLNASPMLVSPGAQPLAYTSPFSYASLPNGTSLGGPFAVAAEQHVLRGLVVVVSSPYALSNGLINYTGNSALLRAVTGGSTPCLVAFLWRPTLAQAAWAQAYAYLAPIKSYAGLVGLAASLAAGAIAYLVRPSKRSGGDELRDVALRHPEWDRGLLEELHRERERSRGPGEG